MAKVLVLLYTFSTRSPGHPIGVFFIVKVDDPATVFRKERRKRKTSLHMYDCLVYGVERAENRQI